MGKTLIGAFQGIFHGDRDFFDLLIVPSVTRDNLEIKKVEISMKIPRKAPISVFTSKKNIVTNFTEFLGRR